MRFYINDRAGRGHADELGAAAQRAQAIEYAFAERVTFDPAVVLVETALGHRQYIPIKGGTVVGR